MGSLEKRMTSELSCVVLNYNNGDILADNVPLLLADRLRVVVVDNGSDDGSREYLENFAQH